MTNTAPTSQLTGRYESAAGQLGTALHALNRAWLVLYSTADPDMRNQVGEAWLITYRLMTQCEALATY